MPPPSLSASLPWLIAGTGLTTLLLLILPPLARKVGLVDRPNARKQHAHPIPVVGGLAMLPGALLGLHGVGITLDTPSSQAFIVGMVGLTLVGLLDDRFDLSVPARFGAQALAGVAMVLWGGDSVNSLGNLMGGGRIDITLVAAPFTVICVVGVINALNMTDGIDGLAGGLTLIGFGQILLLALAAQQVEATGSALAFIFVLIPFLAFNARLFGRPRAFLFMGDAGSMLLGFAMVWHTVRLSQGDLAIMSPAVALWVLAVPLLDMFGAFVRRLTAGHSPFNPDRKHLHHILLQRGFGVKGSCRIMITGAILAGVVGVGGQLLLVPEVILFLLILLLFATTLFFGIRN
ncbi:MAG: undecaprenyl/decaprenyl-phosphate alpha-N-acetylglucosaminyl 1-phosphate transferase [Magnetococcales bacterium]|nr:undecaprenyl/decaprenyl-phosphate alpha-N-acetylglucosaminyl 1-phosphate transferase [Magnetococcales bacterium]